MTYNSAAVQYMHTVLGSKESSIGRKDAPDSIKGLGDLKFCITETHLHIQTHTQKGHAYGPNTH